MRIVEQTPDRLVLHDGPWGMRAMGVLFAGVGIGTLVMMIAGHHAGEHNAWVAFVVGGAFAIMGLVILLTAADRRIVFDGRGKLVRTVRRGLFGGGTLEYPFSSIRDIALEPSSMSGSSDNKMYRIVFVLRDGTHAPWTPTLTGDIGNQARCVAAARAFGGWDSASNSSTGSAAASGSGGTALGAAGGAVVAANASAGPTRAKDPQNLKLMGCFLGFFALIGVVMMGVQAERLLVWRPVPAVVLWSQLETVQNRNGVSYRPVVSYQYVVDGRTYQTSSVSIFSEARGFGWATGVSESYRPGAAVTAYIDPTNPAHAFLLHRMSMIPFLIIAFPLTIGAIIFSATRWYTRQADMAAAVNVPVLPATTDLSSRVAEVEARGR